MEKHWSLHAKWILTAAAFCMLSNSEFKPISCMDAFHLCHLHQFYIFTTRFSFIFTHSFGNLHSKIFSFPIIFQPITTFPISFQPSNPLQSFSNHPLPLQFGYTALHQASQQGHIAVVMLLLKQNASPNALSQVCHLKELNLKTNDFDTQTEFNNMVY